jgi:hypothetical protein
MLKNLVLKTISENGPSQSRKLAALAVIFVSLATSWSLTAFALASFNSEPQALLPTVAKAWSSTFSDVAKFIEGVK